MSGNKKLVHAVSQTGDELEEFPDAGTPRPTQQQAGVAVDEPESEQAAATNGEEQTAVDHSQDEPDVICRRKKHHKKHCWMLQDGDDEGSLTGYLHHYHHHDKKIKRKAKKWLRKVLWRKQVLRMCYGGPRMGFGFGCRRRYMMAAMMDNLDSSDSPSDDMRWRHGGHRGRPEHHCRRRFLRGGTKQSEVPSDQVVEDGNKATENDGAAAEERPNEVEPDGDFQNVQKATQETHKNKKNKMLSKSRKLRTTCSSSSSTSDSSSECSSSSSDSPSEDEGGRMKRSNKQYPHRRHGGFHHYRGGFRHHRHGFHRGEATDRTKEARQEKKAHKKAWKKGKGFHKKMNMSRARAYRRFC